MAEKESMVMETTQNHTLSVAVATLLKDVSDLKSSMAVNAVETANIKTTISDIRSDVKEIKSDFVSRREFMNTIDSMRKEFHDADTILKEEFVNTLKAIKKDIDFPKKVIYGMSGAIGLSLLAAVLKLILK